MKIRAGLSKISLGIMMAAFMALAGCNREQATVEQAAVGSQAAVQLYTACLPPNSVPEEPGSGRISGGGW